MASDIEFVGQRMTGLLDVAVAQGGVVNLVGVIVDSGDPQRAIGSSLLRVKDGRFACRDLPGVRIERIAASESEPDVAFALAADRAVFVVRGDDVRREVIPEQEDPLGELTDIVSIGPAVYVSGFDGQVYRRLDGHWDAIDKSLRTPQQSVATPEDVPRLPSRHITALAGSRDDDLFAVGMRGRVWHYDGRVWTELDSPTNVHLGAAVCPRRGELLMAGGGGWLFHGGAAGFRAFQTPNRDTIWDIAFLEGRAFLSTFHALWVLDGEEIVEVKTDLEPPLEPYRLSANAHELWSASLDDLAYAREGQWHRVLLPD